LLAFIAGIPTNDGVKWAPAQNRYQKSRDGQQHQPNLAGQASDDAEGNHEHVTNDDVVHADVVRKDAIGCSTHARLLLMLQSYLALAAEAMRSIIPRHDARVCRSVFMKQGLEPCKQVNPGD
jgi:hypothetical protein